MSVRKTSYKNRPAIEVQSARLTAVFLPMDGGKMASLSDDGDEWLAQAEGATYRVLTPEGSYVEAECSGFDDMFPTIDPYTPTQGEYAGRTYPDHGEACRYPARTIIGGDSATFCFQSRVFAVEMMKRVAVTEDGGIEIVYTLINNGNEAFPYIWAAHCMLAGRAGGVIVTNYDQEAPIRMMFSPDNADTLPRDRLGKYSRSGATYKYYYLQPNLSGICGYLDPSTGKQLTMRCTPDLVPWLGVWLNNGGFKGMYNVALEPCSAPFDRPDAAEKANAPSIIPPKSIRKFALRFTIE